MTTKKKAIQLVAEMCRIEGIRKVVFSPGSRSAPLVIAFSQIPEMECIVIPDERAAGYFALGMSQQLRETVALVCTSGTAVLNLSPAVCEAFYQKVSLLVITADRPKSAERIGENQAIIQNDIFGSFACCNQIDGDANTKDELVEVMDSTLRAIQQTRLIENEPSQLNIRLSEPLYETTNNVTPVPALPEILYNKNFVIDLINTRKIKKRFTALEKKMIIVGTHDYSPKFLKLLRVLSKRSDLIIVYENLSNINAINGVWNIDSCVSSVSTINEEAFIPDIVVTLGIQIVSKKLKQFLFDKPKVHWDVPIQNSIIGRNRDMFGVLNTVEAINEKQFLDILLNTPEENSSTFKKNWQALSKKAAKKSKEYFSKIPFTDLKIFETLVKSFPDNANIQYGNSSPIRYSNLFEHKKTLTVNANRGASGIDGCVSTAVGAAYANKRMTICVVGDISFFYDSNALWNNYLSPDLRIIIINNGGGNIFRMIDGPTKLKDFEKFFESKHTRSAELLATMFGLPYYICNSQKGLDKILKTFYKPQNGKPAILEIKTDGPASATVYKEYFDYLKQNVK